MPRDFLCRGLLVLVLEDTIAGGGCRAMLCRSTTAAGLSLQLLLRWIQQGPRLNPLADLFVGRSGFDKN